MDLGVIVSRQLWHGKPDSTSLITIQANIAQSRISDEILLKLWELSGKSGLQVRQEDCACFLWGFVKGMMSCHCLQLCLHWKKIPTSDVIGQQLLQQLALWPQLNYQGTMKQMTYLTAAVPCRCLCVFSNRLFVLHDWHSQWYDSQRKLSRRCPSGGWWDTGRRRTWLPPLGSLICDDDGHAHDYYPGLELLSVFRRLGSYFLQDVFAIVAIRKSTKRLMPWDFSKLKYLIDADDMDLSNAFHLQIIWLLQ